MISASKTSRPCLSRIRCRRNRMSEEQPGSVLNKTMAPGRRKKPVRRWWTTPPQTYDRGWRSISAWNITIGNLLRGRTIACSQNYLTAAIQGPGNVLVIEVSRSNQGRWGLKSLRSRVVGKHFHAIGPGRGYEAEIRIWSDPGGQ